MNASTMFYTKVGNYRTLHLWRKEEGKEDEEVRLIDTEDLTYKVFYMLEEQQDIDIQAIEELDMCKFGHNNTISQQEAWYIEKVNELVQAVKQLDRKVNSN